MVQESHINNSGECPDLRWNSVLAVLVHVHESLRPLSERVHEFEDAFHELAEISILLLKPSQRISRNYLYRSTHIRESLVDNLHRILLLNDRRSAHSANLFQDLIEDGVELVVHVLQVQIQYSVTLLFDVAERGSRRKRINSKRSYFQVSRLGCRVHRQHQVFETVCSRCEPIACVANVRGLLCGIGAPSDEGQRDEERDKRLIQIHHERGKISDKRANDFKTDTIGKERTLRNERQAKMSERGRSVIRS